MAGPKKLSPSVVKRIFQSKDSAPATAKRFNVSPNLVYLIRDRRIHKATTMGLTSPHPENAKSVVEAAKLRAQGSMLTSLPLQYLTVWLRNSDAVCADRVMRTGSAGSDADPSPTTTAGHLTKQFQGAMCTSTDNGSGCCYGDGFDRPHSNVFSRSTLAFGALNRSNPA